MRMRTLDQAVTYFKDQDPDTALTWSALRRMILSGQIPHVAVGNKRLVDLDVIEDCLYSYPADGQPEGVRRVEVRQ